MSGEDKLEDDSPTNNPLEDTDASKQTGDSTCSTIDLGTDTSVEETSDSAKQEMSVDTSVEILEDTRNRNSRDQREVDDAALETIKIDNNDTVELETTSSSVDCLDTTKDDTVDGRTSSEEASVVTQKKKEDLGNGEEEQSQQAKCPDNGEMLVLDTAGDRSANDASTSKKDLGKYPENPYDVISMDTSGDTSSQETSDKATDESLAGKKENLGIYPENPYLDDMITLDTSGETSSQGVPRKIENALAKKKGDLGKYPENPYGDVISLDTSGEVSSESISDKTNKFGLRKKLKREQISTENVSMQDMFILDKTGESNEDKNDDKDAIHIEGVLIDVDGDKVNSSSNIRRLAPYPVQEIPYYSTNVTGVLSDIEYNMETGKKVNDPRPKKCCFNCLGDHNVPECPEPADPQRIAMNRKKQLSNRISNVRYHEDSDNKYGHIQPGKISDTLRYALGLRHDELPMYIYRMRCMGYPPGWLKEAEVRQADMKLYDGSGHSVSHPDSEEGEAEPTLVKYNPDKLISFPGFNVDVPRGMRDEWRDLNFPPMQHHHRKSEFARIMGLNRADPYRKKKLKDESLRSNKSQESILQTSTMDIDDQEVNLPAEIEFNPPLPDEPMPPLPPDDTPSSTPKRPLDVEEGELLEDESQSSIGYLEAKRKELLKQLESSGNNSNDAAVASGKETLNSTDNENDTESSNQCIDDSENSVSSSSEAQAKKKVKHHRSHSKGFKLGAAIPPSITPYHTLPDPVHWTVDVTDHINFENLPDALGTWHKMKGLVHQVRKRMSELHPDDD